MYVSFCFNFQYESNLSDFMYIYIDLVLVLAFAFVSKSVTLASRLIIIYHLDWLYYNIIHTCIFFIWQWVSLVPTLVLCVSVHLVPLLASMSSCLSLYKPSCWWHSNLGLCSISKHNLGKHHLISYHHIFAWMKCMKSNSNILLMYSLVHWCFAHVCLMFIQCFAGQLKYSCQCHW